MYADSTCYESIALPKTKLHVRKNFFSVRVVNRWNNLQNASAQLQMCGLNLDILMTSLYRARRPSCNCLNHIISYHNMLSFMLLFVYRRLSDLKIPLNYALRRPLESVFVMYPSYNPKLYDAF